MSHQQPTTILSQATVLTMDPQLPRAEAVAVRQGRIVAVGTNAAVLSRRGPATRVIDCRGAVIMPGFIDAHLHLRALAATFLGLDCRPHTVRSLGALQTLLRRQAGRTPPGQWLVGYGYDEFALAERRHPTRWDLDAAAPQHPVRLAHRSRHAWALNSLALARLGITREFAAPDGGTVARDPASGEPTGLLIDMDAYLRAHLEPLTTPEVFRGALKRASQSLFAAGVTTIGEASVSNDLASYDAFRAWIADGDVGVRVALLLGAPSLPDAVDAGLKPGAGTPFLRLRGVKIRLDEARGGLYPPPDVVNAQVWSAHRQGFPVAIHALELPALVSALHAIRLAQERLPRPGLRHRIEHCALCPEVCMDELAALRVAVVTQPAFLRYHGQRYMAEIEPEQQPWLYRVKSLLDRGIPVAGSSDAPVVPPQPLQGVCAAVTRQTPDGRVIGPEERVSVPEALWLFTQGAAWACGLEASVGSISRGKRADLVVLGADPGRVPPDEIPQIPVRLTMVDGAVRWGAEA
ncbi:MAG: amidohydrolase [Candidatus Tectomicrobia bacterium]|nr:amidohydrolase [Candidatus Tectomicrobia bacterium]